MPTLDALDTMNLEEFSDRAKFPDRVFMLEYANGRYGGYHFGRDKLHGLVCFSSANGAMLFSEHVGETGSKTVEFSFEEAVEMVVVRRRHVPQLQCLFLMDNGFDAPTATYWLDR